MLGQQYVRYDAIAAGTLFFIEIMKNITVANQKAGKDNSGG